MTDLKEIFSEICSEIQLYSSDNAHVKLKIILSTSVMVIILFNTTSVQTVSKPLRRKK